MVGGVVIGLTRTTNRTHVHVADCQHYPKHGVKAESVEGCPRPDTCCVYTDEINQNTGDRVTVNIGDSFWWQCGKCYWTPKENRQLPDEQSKCGVTFDIPLTKLGYSH